MSGKNTPLGHSEKNPNSFATTANQLARMQQILDAGVFISRSEMVRVAVACFQTQDVRWEEPLGHGVCKKSVSYKLATYWGQQLPEELRGATMRRSMNRLLDFYAKILDSPILRILPPDPAEEAARKKENQRAYKRAYDAAHRLSRQEYNRAYREAHPVKYAVTRAHGQKNERCCGE